jgi:hypothetical protein
MGGLRGVRVGNSQSKSPLIPLFQRGKAADGHLREPTLVLTRIREFRVGNGTLIAQIGVKDTSSGSSPDHCVSALP